MAESAIRTLVGRGQKVESVHSAAAAHCAVGAAPVLFGPPATSIFLRSLAKPFQTLALFAAGVIDHFRLTDEEIAVATGSHAGEQFHHDLVAQMLARAGLNAESLSCGVHPPFSARERARRKAAGEKFSALGNNCSGKHAGMLLHAVMLKAPVADYLDAAHPVQLSARRLLECFFDLPLAGDACAIDGCGVPTYFLSLDVVARGFARLHDPVFLEAIGLCDAARRLHAALASNLRAFSGEGRLPSRFRPLLGEGAHAKEGAEGSFAVWGPRGALVMKSLDGQERGVRYALPAILSRLGWIDAESAERWRREDPPVVQNVAGRQVGEIRVELDGVTATA